MSYVEFNDICGDEKEVEKFILIVTQTNPQTKNANFKQILLATATEKFFLNF